MSPIFRVLVTARSFGKSSREPIALLEDNGCAITWRPGPIDAGEMAGALVDKDAVIVGADAVDEKAIAGAERLKIISMHGVGVSHIDLMAAKRKGIVVANVPGGNAEAVAELTWAFILSLTRGVMAADTCTKSGKWPAITGSSVFRKQLGIIGLGAVGKKVAEIATGFQMNLLAFDPVRDEAFADKWGVYYTDLESLLPVSDIVTVHVPLIDATRHLLNRTVLGWMKNTAYLVNTSRGGVVDEHALTDLIKKGGIAGAATDVYEVEPPTPDNPLLSTPGVITTPHMGGRTSESLTFTSLKAAQNVLHVLQGDLSQVTVVNIR